MKNRYLIIEGTPNESNGSLRVAFGRLLEKAGISHTKVVMAGSWSDALKKYSEYPNCTAYVLVDGDAFQPKKADHIPSYKCHVMQPAFEEWLILESTALCDYYNQHKGPKHNTSKPTQAIKDWLKTNVPSRRYHKVQDAAKILVNMDTVLLRQKSSDFDTLVKALSAK
jgi:hypothetical protein